jgi:hypothetical protein
LNDIEENSVGATLDRNEKFEQKIESKFQITPWRGTINTAVVTQTVTTVTTNHCVKKTDTLTSIHTSIRISIRIGILGGKFHGYFNVVFLPAKCSNLNEALSAG